jgi:hypothetical protein
MSVEYEFDEENGVLYTRFFGVVTDEDLRAQAEAVAADDRIGPKTRELVDLTGIEEIEASPDTFEDIIRIDRAHAEKLSGSQTAIVAPTDVLFGYSRMFETLTDLRESPTRTRAFRTLEEAEAWLGLRQIGI